VRSRIGTALASSGLGAIERGEQRELSVGEIEWAQRLVEAPGQDARCASVMFSSCKCARDINSSETLSSAPNAMTGDLTPRGAYLATRKPHTNHCLLTLRMRFRCCWYR
jgi:hypothetical protein